MAAALKKFLRDAKAEEEDSSSDEEQESEWMIECWTLVEPKTDDKGLGDHAKQAPDDRRATRRQSSDLNMMMMLMMMMIFKNCTAMRKDSEEDGCRVCPIAIINYHRIGDRCQRTSFYSDW
jgi:hypothetical protein